MKNIYSTSSLRTLLLLITAMTPWSINAQVVKVYQNGALSATYANTTGTKYKVIAEEASTPTPSHDYVEIGGVKWATMNLGATTVAGNYATCYGDYYAWGETEPRYTSITISGENSATFGGWSSSHSSGYSTSDYPTYKGTTLDADHDAATQNWGSNWRTPTGTEFQALAKACSGSSSNQSISALSTSTPTGGIYWLPSDQTYLSEYMGVAGVLFVDNTDASKRVFFPAAGRCENTDLNQGGESSRYWSSSFIPSNPNNAYRLLCNSSTLQPSVGNLRYFGYTVRPVLIEEEKQVVKVYKNGSLCATYANSSINKVKVVFEESPTGAFDGHDWVKIGGVKWATMNLGATTVAGSPSACYGDYYAWGETEPRYTSMTITGESSATVGGWSSSHSSGYTDSDYPTYTGETLDADHDAATQNWGSNWRTPTKADFEALVKACTGSTSNIQDLSTLSTSTPTGGIYRLESDQTYLSDYTGVAGILCVDKTDASKRVFFPAAGEFFYSNLTEGSESGYYWSSTSDTDDTDVAYCTIFTLFFVNSMELDRCCFGFPIRPVTDVSDITFVTSIALNKASLQVVVGKTKTLTATALPADATIQTVTWTSSNTAVATVSSEGVVTAVAAGKATITATANDGSGVRATCAVTVTPKHEYVEIGGVKWATMNLGATTVAGDPSTCYGDYYACGETEPRYTSITITGKNSVSVGGWSSSHSSGYSDSDYPTYTGTTLDADHDAATQNWGSAWRTPTQADFKALAKACTGSTSDKQKISTLSTSTPTGGIYWLPSDQTYLSDYTGVDGILYVDATDTSKRVFFPAAGEFFDSDLTAGGTWGYYWSSTRYPSNTNVAYSTAFHSTSVDSNWMDYCCYGFTVRPVYDDTNLLSGKFSVSDNKQVQFTKGNLYYSITDSKYHLEPAQNVNYTTLGHTAYDSTHVCHLYWSNTTDWQTSGMEPWAETFGRSAVAKGDKLFCGEDNKMTVDDTEGLFALSSDEWAYLIGDNTNRSGKYSKAVSVTTSAGTVANCVVIAPDECLNGYTFDSSKTSYTADEWATAEAAGLVCLPAGGLRHEKEIGLGGNYLMYLTSTSDAADEYAVWYLMGNAENVRTRTISERNFTAGTVRLVTDATVRTKSITLDNTSLSIIVGNTKTLTATALPADATMKTVTWTSSNTAVATVSSEGVVTAVAEGTATITATANDGSGVSATCSVTVTLHDYVEIGGVKWATMNLGATTVAGDPSTCYGDYYAWGETEPRYTSVTIRTRNEGITADVYEWKSEHSDGYSGYPTYTGTTLDATHDAATQNWGSNWRTPTADDFVALAIACSGSSSTQSISTLSTSTPTGGIYWLPSDQTYLWDYTGVAGILFVDKTDTSKRVFFPATGIFEDSDLDRAGSYGYYWSSTLDTYWTEWAYGMCFETYIQLYPNVELNRYNGFPVRPVFAR